MRQSRKRTNDAWDGMMDFVSWLIGHTDHPMPLIPTETDLAWGEHGVATLTFHRHTLIIDCPGIFNDQLSCETLQRLRRLGAKNVVKLRRAWLGYIEQAFAKSDASAAPAMTAVLAGAGFAA